MMPVWLFNLRWFFIFWANAGFALIAVVYLTRDVLREPPDFTRHKKYCWLFYTSLFLSGPIGLVIILLTPLSTLRLYEDAAQAWLDKQRKPFKIEPYQLGHHWEENPKTLGASCALCFVEQTNANRDENCPNSLAYERELWMRDTKKTKW